MLMTLEEAQKLKSDLTQEELDGLEQSIRALTNNKFQNLNVRFIGFDVTESNKLVFNTKLAYLRIGDTIEVSETWSNIAFSQSSGKGVNDGLFVITEIADNIITLGTDKLFDGQFPSGFITKIEYPPDIISGVQKLLKYDAKMESKTGIKSESISRMSITYYDVNNAENVEGFPASLMSFLNKYKKLRWS